ncbi:hypothetical protein [Mycobacterium sp. 852014-50255_SCH5639931]|uniref:hypothetical protein n=1 Tax=Mycobacterium sp. 852014-50255_SCH5639931 TaxID=1834112 RepID=UPI0007FEA179|nr:hypothetical protein [Mycobacterium sp. 852014-50255_SCH5639931]OBB63403.1 hypothetical protein A5758_23470 [Mycobacterium sp. 852014-50255_SCH5639931]
MSTIEDFRSTTFAALPYEDLTVAEAWASSPLGDPTIEDDSLVQPVESEDSPATTVIAKPRSRGTNALLAGAVVAALGAVAGLGLLLVDGPGSKEHKPAVVVPNSSVGSVTPQAPSAVAPPPVAPAPPSAAAPADAAQVSPGPVSRGDAPVVVVPAPAPAAPAAPPAPADPGAPPPPPNVTVNVPPVIVPVPVPVPVPPQQGGGQQGGGQPAPSGGSGHGPIQCFACHPPQPVHPQPIHPQPIQPQPIRLQPLQHP